MNLDSQLRLSLGDPYVLERELEAGGMARVFVAREVALGRRVVVKVLPPEMSSAVLAERFRREISLAAQLRHPHIVPLLTAGEAGGLLYYTMPFVEGQTLRARLASGPALPMAEGIRVIREIAAALSHAHSRGVVHRDIKPENVLLENGHAVVADFGVAKALANAADDNRTAAGSLTTAGFVMGTLTYMAPEQAAADPAIDHRADLYALGVVAYEMFAGAPPFRGTPHQVIAAHLIEQPEPLSSLRPDLPRPLSDLVMQLLAKSPADRPASAVDVVHALESVVPSSETSRPDLPLKRTTGSALEQNATTRTGSWVTVRRVVATAAILLAVAAAYGGFQLLGRGGGVTGDSDHHAVAVLPFVNTSGDVESEHFSNGLTDELISALGQVRGLKVAARTSVYALNGRGLGAREIADTLNVATVIEGSARRDGRRLKVTAQLVNAADGSVLWSQAFNREMVDVFAVQEEITRAIVGALDVRLSEDERSHLAGRPTENVEAYDQYLKGRYSWNKRSREGMESALAYFQNAIRHDPDFALPYAGMAYAYVVMSNYNWMPLTEALANAETAADRALALDRSLPEAHTAKAFVLASRRRFAESEAAFRQAIQLNPSYSEAHHFYSLLLMMLGRTGEAVAENRLTLSLDPLSVPGNANRGIITAQRGNYDDASRELRNAIPMSGANALAPYYLGALEAAGGQYSEALSLLQRAHRYAPGFPGVKGALAYTYSRLERRREADSIMVALRASGTDDDRARIQLALAEAVNGDINRAYAILQRPAQWDVPTIIELRADPLLRSFRADRRYAQLLAAMGLSP